MATSRIALMAALIALPLAGCGALKGDGGPKTPTVGKRESILSNDNSIKVDPALASVPVVLPDPTPNAAWSQSGGNASKTPGHPALGTSRGQAWSAQISGNSKTDRLASSPVIADNRLIAIGTDAVVTAFAADTGARIWATSIATENRQYRNILFGGGVGVEGSVVYAASGAGDVVAMNAADGSVIWKAKPGGLLRGAPTIAYGSVYVISQDNQIFALNASDGTVVWQATASAEAGSVFGAASPAAGQSTIVAGFSSGEVQAYRYENGRDLWEDALARTSMALSVSTLTDVDADPVVDRGRVFALGQGGRMASYDLLSGQRIWEISIAGISTPYVVGDWVYAITDDAKLMAVARGTGKVRWLQQLARFRVESEKKKKDPIRWTGPILAGGRLIAVNSEGQMVEFSPSDGSTLATSEFKSAISQSPVVANNTLYVLEDNGRITAWR
jgi:outer membrane protein assembly factor BamB